MCDLVVLFFQLSFPKNCPLSGANPPPPHPLKELYFHGCSLWNQGQDQNGGTSINHGEHVRGNSDISISWARSSLLKSLHSNHIICQILDLSASYIMENG